MKLYKITVQRVGVSPFYVIANDPTEAHNKVKALMEDDYFRADSEIRFFELLAEDGIYPDCGMRLIT